MSVSLADLLGRLSSAWLADRIGRRWVMFSYGMIGAVGLLISAGSVMLATSAGWSTTGAGWIFFGGIVIAMAFGDGAFGVLNPFGAEQFPNEARATGLGLGYGIGSSAKVFGPALLGGDVRIQGGTRVHPGGLPALRGTSGNGRRHLSLR